jgi:hypothetical protein
MMILRVIILFVLASFISGCSFVKSVNKLGEEPYTANENEWKGTWIVDDNSIQIKVINHKLGEIEIMFIEAGKLLKNRVFLTQKGSETYLNLVEKPEDKFYYPAKFKKSKNQLIVWRVSSDALKKAIRDKKIDGEITKHKYSDDVLIKASKEELNNFFIRNREQMLFDYEEPFVLRRLVQ